MHIAHCTYFCRYNMLIIYFHFRAYKINIFILNCILIQHFCVIWVLFYWNFLIIFLHLYINIINKLVKSLSWLKVQKYIEIT